MMERAPRMGIIGARRARQGLGPFVARDLTAAGCNVVGFCTSSPATVEEARRQLLSFDVDAEGFGSAAELLAAGLELDGVAILSPAQSHAEHLGLALAANLHVLCEKPLLIQGDSPEPLLRSFEEGNLLLLENCQWPAALESLAQQDPRFSGAPKTSFAMGLAPEGRGMVLLEESLSHPISLLQECLGSELSFGRPRWDWSPGQEAVTVQFDAMAQQGTISVSIELACSDARPRPAWIEFDGLRAHREVNPEDYSMGFRLGEEMFPIPDPLTTHLAHFSGLLRATLGGSEPPPPSPMIQRAALFDALIQSALITLP